MRLNRGQRKILLATSAVLAAFLLFEIGDVGFSDSHWIVGAPAIAVCLLLAASGPGPFSNSSELSEDVLRSRLSSQGSDEGEAIVRKRFHACANQWAEFLRSSLVDVNPKMPRNERSRRADLGQMIAQKVAFASYLVVISARRPEAIQEEDANSLRRIASEDLSKLYLAQLAGTAEALRQFSRFTGGGGDILDDQDAAMQLALEQLILYELLAKTCLSNFRKQQPSPMDPLFTKVSEEMGLGLGSPEDRESFFGIKVKQEFGRLLHPSPGVG